MKKINQLSEEITFLEIKYRLLKNKNLIGVFTFLSFLISTLLAFNQKNFFEGKMYFAGDPYEEIEDFQSAKKKLKINKINPNVRKFILDAKKIESLRERSDDVVSELAKNSVILKRVYSNLESNKLFNKNDLIDFNSWSKKFSFSNDTEFRGVFFIDKNKDLVINSLNNLKEVILESPEYKQKMKGFVTGFDYQRKNIKNKLVISHNFFGPSLQEVRSISKFPIIFIGTFFGISVISLFSIYKDSLLGIISNKKKFINLIPYPLLRDFPIKQKKSWEKGLNLLNNVIEIKDANICLITITRKFPDSLNYLRNVFKEYYKNSDLFISNEISLENKSSKNILVVYPNQISEEDLTILIQDLENSGKNILGWIYLY